MLDPPPPHKRFLGTPLVVGTPFEVDSSVVPVLAEIL